jgi:hypothetical protein
MIMVTKTMKTMDEFMQQQQEEEEEEEKARGRPALQLTTMESSFSTEFVRRFSTSSPCEEQTQTRLRRRPLQRERQPLSSSSSSSTTTTKAAVTNDILIQINNSAVVALSPATAANLTLNGRRPVWHAASASDPSDLEAVCALNVAAAAAAAAFY